MPRNLSGDRHSLGSIRNELVFTEARLASDENAKELAPTFAQLKQRLDEVRADQLMVWEGEALADAAIAAADDALDDWVQGLHVSLSHILKGDTDLPRYRRYFSAPPSAIVRLGLERQLGSVRGWVDSLSSEPEADLQAHAKSLSDIIVRGDGALDARRKAAAKRTDHRVRAIDTLMDDINNARLSVYGMLVKKAAELRLPRNWPDRFFHRGTRMVPPQAETPAPEAPAASTPQK